MVELFESGKMEEARHSSKGNQLKWNREGRWYKADYTGYEGLAEYMVSHLLQRSSLRLEEYVLYETEELRYGNQCYLGCHSRDFLAGFREKYGGNWQMVTLERLFHSMYGESLYKSIYQIREYEERLRFLVGKVERLTGLEDFGRYMGRLLTVDALFLNEDRHTHNIAVLWDGGDRYEYCPMFDHGASLLADTTMDYPLGQDVILLMPQAEAKTICRSFDEQVDIAEVLYGDTMKFSFGEKDIRELLGKDEVYPEPVKRRVYNILLQRRQKYQYLFR